MSLPPEPPARTPPREPASPKRRANAGPIDRGVLQRAVPARPTFECELPTVNVTMARLEHLKARLGCFKCCFEPICVAITQVKTRLATAQNSPEQECMGYELSVLATASRLRALRLLLDYDMYMSMIRMEGLRKAAVLAAADGRGRGECGQLVAPGGAGPGKVIFYGSSLITYWRHLAEDFAPLPVVNSGFGGSVTPTAVEMFEDCVGRYKPSLLVLYCGTDDLLLGGSAEAVLQGFVDLLALKEAQCGPSVPVLYLTIQTSALHETMGGRARVAEIARANRLVVDFIEANRGPTPLRYIDLDACGLAGPAHFLADGHHLNDAGHALLAAKIRPVLETLYQPLRRVLSASESDTVESPPARPTVAPSPPARPEPLLAAPSADSLGTPLVTTRSWTKAPVAAPRVPSAASLPPLASAAPPVAAPPAPSAPSTPPRDPPRAKLDAPPAKSPKASSADDAAPPASPAADAPRTPQQVQRSWLASSEDAKSTDSAGAASKAALSLDASKAALSLDISLETSASRGLSVRERAAQIEQRSARK